MVKRRLEEMKKKNELERKLRKHKEKKKKEWNEDAGKE